MSSPRTARPSRHPVDATPYINTISAADQPAYPGDLDLEARLTAAIRWNAVAMVVRANRRLSGIGGHLATYQSAATIWEVGFHHFFRGKGEPDWGDQVYFQGHASPGVYARAFLEGRLNERDLDNFRRELAPDGGLSSYPHPWLMPELWEFPTVSMGITALTAIYQARFNHYLADRGLRDTSKRRVWALLGDGELDEPESLGAITLAAREHLDNLVFIVNCNMQRLDGPVRGNGKIVQELETAFRGAGWNVVKALWGSGWDPLFERDAEGLLAQRLTELVDGQFQKFTVSGGDAIRREIFGADPRLVELAKNLSDDDLVRLNLDRGGHDPIKVHAALAAAVRHAAGPSVILFQTVKGYGMGEAGEGLNITHQQKKMTDDQLRYFRDRFQIPIDDAAIGDVPFLRPAEDSEEMQYLFERRRQLGGFLPKRIVAAPPTPHHASDLFNEFDDGTGDREVTTTMVFVKILVKLMKDPKLGRHIVPIVPDEARTFGMESMFRQFGIYSHTGQMYDPVDSDNLLYYKEATDGQMLEEGITEAGAMSSFIAAGTAHATHGVQMIPFFIFYSMFGFQRIGDFIWAAADNRARGFLLGATSGRTTLNGEGLQHQDGNSHAIAFTVPNCEAYDPAYAYELATILRHGLRRMYYENEDVFHYVTVMNEFMPMPARPEEADDESIVRGLYRYRRAALQNPDARAQLLGSGTILNQVVKAQEKLAEYGVAAEVWSATSYKALYRDGCDCDRFNMLHPDCEPRKPYVAECLERGQGDVVVAATDYIKMVPASIGKWIQKPFVVLGTDGFGRSDGRDELRDFFEVDWRFVALATLNALSRAGKLPADRANKAIQDLEIDPDKLNPAIA